MLDVAMRMAKRIGGYILYEEGWLLNGEIGNFGAQYALREKWVQCEVIKDETPLP